MVCQNKIDRDGGRFDRLNDKTKRKNDEIKKKYPGSIVYGAVFQYTQECRHLIYLVRVSAIQQLDGRKYL